jgi:hypothetical protein
MTSDWDALFGAAGTAAGAAGQAAGSGGLASTAAGAAASGGMPPLASTAVPASMAVPGGASTGLAAAGSGAMPSFLQSMATKISPGVGQAYSGLTSGLQDIARPNPQLTEGLGALLGGRSTLVPYMLGPNSPLSQLTQRMSPSTRALLTTILSKGRSGVPSMLTGGYKQNDPYAQQ